MRTQPIIDALLCNEIVKECTDMSGYEVCDFWKIFGPYSKFLGPKSEKNPPKLKEK